MAFMKWGVNSITLMYLPLIAVFNIMRYYCAGMIDKEMEAEAKSMHTMTLAFIILFGEVFGGIGAIYLFFMKKKEKKISETRNETTAKLQFSILKILSKQKGKISYVMVGIIILSLIHFLITVIFSLLFFHYSIYEYQGIKYNSIFDYEMVSIQILFIIILSYYVLGYSLYRHQWLSVGIIAIGICLIIFPNISYELYLGIRIPLLLLMYFFSSIEGVFEKFLMERKYISPHQFALFNGIIGIILCSITSLICQFTLSSTQLEMIGFASAMFTEFYECLSTHPLLFHLAFFGCSLYAIVIKMTRYHYTPTHCCVAETFCALVFYLSISIGSPISRVNTILSIIGYVLLVIGGLLYNEIIMLYVCSLQLYTKREIIKRSRLDYQAIKDNEINIEIKAIIDEDHAIIDNSGI